MLGNIVPGHPTGDVNKGARLRALIVAQDSQQAAY